jgi:hypothetical protein
MFTILETLENLEKSVVNSSVRVCLAVVIGKIDVGFKPGVVIEGCDKVPVHVKMLVLNKELATLEIRDGILLSIL